MATVTVAPTSVSTPAVPALAPRPKGHSKRWWLSAAAALLAVAGVVVFRSVRERGPLYVTARIDRGDIDSTVGTTGNLNAVVTVQVGSQVSGNIIALYADFNTKVKKGQLVAVIDPAPFEAAVAQSRGNLNAAEAAVQTARAAVAKSQADVATATANVAVQQANVLKAESAARLAQAESVRRATLLQQDATSREDAESAWAAWEQAASTVNSAEATVNAARAAEDSARRAVDSARAQLTQAEALVRQDKAILAQAELNLQHTRILAPVDGTVQSRNMDVGQTVAASFQAPTIFLIAQDLTKMQVDTNVDEADVAAVRVGQKATFTVDAYPGQIFTGQVAQIRKAPINVQNVITYDVVIAVGNPDLKLFPGMTATASIYTGHASKVLRVPRAALRFHPSKSGNSQTVYMLDGKGRPYPIPVKLGLSDANYSELLAGDVAEGSIVVTGTQTQAAAPARASGSSRRLGL